MRNAGRLFGAVVAGAFAFLAGVSHAFAYDYGDVMCQVTDDFPQDGIQFACSTDELVGLLQATVYGGPGDAFYARTLVFTADRGEACYGTVTCNIEFDTAGFYDVLPGDYKFIIPEEPSRVNASCYCR